MQNIQKGGKMTNKYWEKMDTAPKDGTQILGYIDGEMYVTEWFEWCAPDGKCFKGFKHQGVLSNSFTHWQPLPKAPGDLFSIKEFVD